MIGSDRLQPRKTAAMGILASLLESRTGQLIAPNRTWRIETALQPLLRARGLGSLDDLVGQLVGDAGGVLADMIVDALLNQETSFFRDAGIIEAIVAFIDDHGSKRARIWSAACSTGQEPLSLAMLCAERAAQGDFNFPEIVATDVSDAAIRRARMARYTSFEIQRGLPVRRMINWFEAQGEEWVAKPELVQHIHYRRHNLVADAPPMGGFDVILCRNVLMYLSLELRQRIFERLARALRPGGVLVLGAGETVIGQGNAFVPSTRMKGFYELAPAAQERSGTAA